MTLFGNSKLRRLQARIDHAVFNLCILAEKNITPAMYQSFERDIWIATQSAVAAGKAVEVRQALERARAEVPTEQLARWGAIIDRALQSVPA